MGHWYSSTGDSCHTVVGKNGKERGTTLRDARVLDLVPSVTNIMDIQSKPMLIRWLQNQVLEAAMASPYNEEEWHEDGWKNYIIKKSKEIGEKAAKRGNEIHDSMENYFKNGLFDDNVDYVTQGIELILSTFPDYTWVAEASFAHKDGFGGRVDLWGTNGQDYVIIDFKTKDKSDVKDMLQYDDHCVQLAAYQVGLQLPENTRRFNLFISTSVSTPGLCKLVECKKFDKYIGIFYALLNLWKCKNNYFPELI